MRASPWVKVSWSLCPPEPREASSGNLLPEILVINHGLFSFKPFCRKNRPHGGSRASGTRLDSLSRGGPDRLQTRRDQGVRHVGDRSSRDHQDTRSAARIWERGHFSHSPRHASFVVVRPARRIIRFLPSRRT
jgi:hypothetical protein